MTADTRAAPTPAEVREQRGLVQLYRDLAEGAERELAAMLAAAGRRPGDGSDQAALFATAAPDLFTPSES